MKEFAFIITTAILFFSCGEEGLTYRKCLDSCNKEYAVCGAGSVNQAFDPTTQLGAFILCNRWHDECRANCREYDSEDIDYYINIYL
jgi:hypothetical protein